MKYPIIASLLFASLLLGALPASAQFSSFYRNRDNNAYIWVTIKAQRGEDVWHACRRVYQRDVRRAYRKSPTRVRCWIHHSRIYHYGERYQNFN